MKKNPLGKGVISENFAGIGTVTPAMVHARARELSTMEARGPEQVTEADLRRAKRELTGGPDIDPQAALLEGLPESKRWDPVPGSEGSQAPETPSEDEDDEGRSVTAQLVNEGAEEAERDRMLRAAQAAKENK